MRIGVKMTGLDEMIDKLKLFEEKLDEEITRQATADGANVILKAMQMRAPIRIDQPTPKSTSLPPGAIRASLSSRMSKKKYGVFVARIGPGKKIRGLVASVEYGHRLVKGGSSRVGKNGMIRGAGREIGHVPAHPFLRPAIDESAQAAINAYARTMWTLSREILTNG